MNIDLGTATWHNFSKPKKMYGLKKMLEAGESFTGNFYMKPKKKKAPHRASSSSRMQPAVICEFSHCHPDDIIRIPLTYNRFGQIQYAYSSNDESS